MTGLPQPRRAPDRNLERNDAVETHLPRGYAQAALRCPAAVPEANEYPGLAAFTLGARRDPVDSEPRRGVYGP